MLSLSPVTFTPCLTPLLPHLSYQLSPHLDSLCPLTSKQARPTPSTPLLSDSVRADRTTLWAAERKWWKSKRPEDLLAYQSLLSSFSTSLFAAKSSVFQSKLFEPFGALALMIP